MIFFLIFPETGFDISKCQKFVSGKNKIFFFSISSADLESRVLSRVLSVENNLACENAKLYES